MSIAVLSCVVFTLSACCTNWNGLCTHHVEGPFALQGGHTGAGIVFGTADFNNSAGSVLIKVQVEDRGDISGNAATVTVWSGNGDAPSTKTDSPGGTQVMQTSGDVTLRFWTNHYLRNYDAVTNKYWVYVKVDHATGLAPPNERDVRYLVWSWTPSATPSPDTPWDFNEIP